MDYIHVEKKRFRHITLGLLFFLLVAATTQVQANQSQNITIGQALFVEQMEPGETKRFTVPIENGSNNVVVIQSEVSVGNIEDKERLSPIHQYINLLNDDILISPDDMDELVFIITLPSDVSNGGYFFTIELIPTIQFSGEKTTTIVQPKIIIPFILNVGLSDEFIATGRIEDIVIPEVIFDNHLQYTFLFTNTSIFHIAAKPVLSVKPLFGKKEKIYLEEKYVFPSRRRDWQGVVQIPNMIPGFYFTDLQISLGNGIKASAKQSFIYLPAWGIITLASLGVVMGIGCRYKTLAQKWGLHIRCRRTHRPEKT